MWTTALWVSIGLVLSNFLFQALTNHNWTLAAEASFFQTIACLTLTWVNTWRRK